MNEYDFTANWSKMTVIPPNSGERCLVTDGDVVVIATYLTDKEGSIWIFSEVNEAKTKPFNVKAWMKLPFPPLFKPIIVNENSSSVAQLPSTLPS